MPCMVIECSCSVFNVHYVLGGFGIKFHYIQVESCYLVWCLKRTERMRIYGCC